MGESSFPMAASKLMTALTNQLWEGSVMEKAARKVKFNATNPILYAVYTFVATKTTQEW